MFTQAFLLALAAASVVNAHGRMDVLTGDLGGNGTALGVKGAVIPGGGANYETEPDTTIFWSKDIATDDDDGFTDSSNGNLSPSKDLAAAMALSGSTLPQVSDGGSITGNWHVVTDDGCGPLQALIDSTASSAWSTAADATVTTDMPGDAGNCVDLDSGDDETVEAENETISSRARRALVKMGLMKRAKNVNKSFSFKVAVPAGTSCTGTVNGISNLCQVKVSNNNANGPFGGTFLVQMGSNSTSKRLTRSAKFLA
ncbi:cell surface protein [Mollisia scopiformis]|uniref:Cell surface protein n=1 Tax=Mollisia scopiformis TaxID=149040 RepID=A0A194X5V2_MOLSC|nr:cell surface protein [Mollisia scopiformis]KUJ15177.1 cell surface protein [Mollisia scopiformis]